MQVAETFRLFNTYNLNTINIAELLMNKKLN